MSGADSSRSESRRRVEAVRQRGPLTEDEMRAMLNEAYPWPYDVPDVDEVAAMHADIHDRQGKRPDQVSFSRMAVGVSLIVLGVVALMLVLAAAVGAPS